ncbi:hypothetical protein KKG24_04655 [Patescibacteria group bacterium]|nr:hypothetical protein [Patescibacteria group bacterium]
MQNTISIYKEVQKRILLYGQTALGEKQFKSFRKLVLDEFAAANKKIWADVETKLLQEEVE